MRKVVAALTVVLLVGGGAATADAHAELVESSPLDGAMLTDLPGAIELTFSEAVGKPADLVVLDPNGTPLATGAVTTVGEVLATTLEPATATEGWHTVSYQVTSADGHLITGTTTFMVHADGDTAMVGEPSAPGPASGAASTSADPYVVGALVLGLAAVLVYALAVVRRLLVTGPEPA